MTALSDAVGDYLSVRRAMGYKLERAEELLRQFVRHLEEVGATTVTVNEAVAWVTMPAGASRAWMGIRMSVVRSFASWLQAREPRTEVPPPDVLGPNPVRRAVPYLYTDAEVAALMDTASRHLRGLQRFTFPTLIGLLAVTGMFSGGPVSKGRPGFTYPQVGGGWLSVDDRDTCGAGTSRPRVMGR